MKLAGSIPTSDKNMQYSREYKKLAVECYKKVKSYTLACKSLGCSRSSLIRWVNQDKVNNNFFNKKEVNYKGYTLPKILTTVISFILIYLATIFPLVAVFVFFQVVLLLSSLIFVFSYENFPSFKNFICKVLFAGDEAFALLYFEFFWGNLNSGNIRRHKL